MKNRVLFEPSPIRAGLRQLGIRRSVISTTVLSLALFASSASATPLGQISIGFTPGGGATGNQELIDWFLPTGGGFGDFTTGSGSVTWNGVGGTNPITFGSNTYGRIADLPVGALFNLVVNGVPFANFIQFYAVGTTLPTPPGNATVQTNPTWSITGFGAVPATNCATNPAVDVACSITIASSSIGGYISPLIFTRNSLGGTSVRLDLLMLGSDSTGSAGWTGIATAQIAGKTPAVVAAELNAGQSVNVQTWSLDMTSVPEPGTMGMAAIGGLLIGASMLRRRVRS